MHGKCNCGKKAVSEYLIQDKSSAWTIKLCDKCEPKSVRSGLVKIDGGAKTQKQKP
jgi:hypothetical protein